jgi:hypothetical protein
MDTGAFDPLAFSPAAFSTAEPLTTDELLAVGVRALDPAYIEPIRDVGPGYELYQASAQVMRRCSLAVSGFAEDIYILTSRGGVLATIQATFFRQNASAGAGRMLAGTIVSANSRGAGFRTVADAVFGPSDLTATAPAVALGYGYEWNILGPFIDPDGVTWPGELDTINLPLQSPIYFDPSILVRNDEASDGLGRPRTLDVLGGERALPRYTNETDANYRARIRTLPDTISPAAIKRQLANYFRQIPGLFWHHVETWQHEYQECFDAPDIVPTPTEPYSSTLFVFDDPGPVSPIRNRWLGEHDYLGAFIVEVAMPPTISDYGFAFDDGALELEDVTTTVGLGAFAAFDVSDSMLPPALAPAYDGVDFGIESFFGNLWTLLDSIKAAGVFVVIKIQEQES